MNGWAKAWVKVEMNKLVTDWMNEQRNYWMDEQSGG